VFEDIVQLTASAYFTGEFKLVELSDKPSLIQ